MGIVSEAFGRALKEGRMKTRRDELLREHIEDYKKLRDMGLGESQALQVMAEYVRPAIMPLLVVAIREAEQKGQAS